MSTRIVSSVQLWAKEGEILPGTIINVNINTQLEHIKK